LTAALEETAVFNSKQNSTDTVIFSCVLARQQIYSQQYVVVYATSLAASL